MLCFKHRKMTPVGSCSAMTKLKVYLWWPVQRERGVQYSPKHILRCSSSWMAWCVDTVWQANNSQAVDHGGHEDQYHSVKSEYMKYVQPYQEMLISSSKELLRDHMSLNTFGTLIDSDVNFSFASISSWECQKWKCFPDIVWSYLPLKPCGKECCSLPAAWLIWSCAHPSEIDIFSGPVADPEADVPAMQVALMCL